MACSKCGYPLDPWGECCRCPNEFEVKRAERKCKELKIRIQRAYSGEYPIGVNAKIEKRVLDGHEDIAKEIISNVCRKKGTTSRSAIIEDGKGIGTS